MEPLPYEIIEAMIQCFGRSFHLKDVMASFLLSASVNKALVDKYKHEMKFPWARHVLSDLGQTENGCLTQKKILTALCRLRNLPDQSVENRDAGLDALSKLKELAIENDLIIREEKKRKSDKTRQADEKLRLIQERAAKLDSLRQKFNAAVSNVDRQEAGYSLEDLLADLFALFELEYKKSYRTETQQIDGHFNFHSFDYLVEAKWRNDQPTEAEIGSFQRKVETKLESTRGFFISVNGYRAEVIEQFNGQGANIILMDGEHLVHILEGRKDLQEALKFMIETAAQRGIVYARFAI